MKCGKGHEHETIAEVRACYGVAAGGTNYTSEHDRPEVQAQGWRKEPASDKQYVLLAKLRNQTGQPARYTGNITKGQASEEISDLIELGKKQQAENRASDPGWASADGDPQGYGDPRPANGQSRYAQASDWPDIPSGYYAAPSLTGAQDYDFWHIQVPEEGRWAGTVFVKRVIGGRADQEIPRESKKRVKSERVREPVTQLAALQAIRGFGPDESNELFGTELKFCRVCGIHLTDETSREIGIGPVCRAGGRD